VSTFEERQAARKAWIDSLAIRSAPPPRQNTNAATDPQPVPWAAVLAQLGIGRQEQPPPDPLERQRGDDMAEIARRVADPARTSEIGPGRPPPGGGTAS
jgi:hypothetical protein